MQETLGCLQVYHSALLHQAFRRHPRLTRLSKRAQAVILSGSIASPVSWSEGSTKGLGFTLYGTNATALPGTWASGSAYAALPSTSTSFYTRSNYTGGSKDILNMRLRLDTATAQNSG